MNRDVLLRPPVPARARPRAPAVQRRAGPGRLWRRWLAVLLTITAVATTGQAVAGDALGSTTGGPLLLPVPPALAATAILPLLVVLTATRLARSTRDRGRRVRWCLAALTVWYATAACCAATIVLAHPQPIGAVQVTGAVLLAVTAGAAARAEPWPRRWG